MKRRKINILAASMIILLTSTSASLSQQRLNPLGRTLPVAPRPSAEQLLEGALVQDKVLGQLDSAAAAYRRVLAEFGRGRGQAATAARARARLNWLQDAGLVEVEERDRTPLRQVLRSTGGLQLGQMPELPQAEPPQPRATPIRQRWLASMARAQRHTQSAEDRTDLAVRLGSGIDALRRGLGLKGLQHYIEQQRRRNRSRPPSAHERYLEALMYEKELQDFGGALVRYQELVQLNPSGGIATRLIERAQSGAARMERYVTNPDGL